MPSLFEEEGMNEYFNVALKTKKKKKTVNINVSCLANVSSPKIWAILVISFWLRLEQPPK